MFRGKAVVCLGVDVIFRLPLFCGLCLVCFRLVKYIRCVVWKVLGCGVIVCLKFGGW